MGHLMPVSCLILVILSLSLCHLRMFNLKYSEPAKTSKAHFSLEKTLRIVHKNGFIEVIQTEDPTISPGVSGFYEYWDSSQNQYVFLHEDSLLKWFTGDLSSAELAKLAEEGPEGRALSNFIVLMDLEYREVSPHIKELTELAANGSGMAQFALGLFYTTGLFVDIDLPRGLVYLRESSRGGNILGGLNMAHRHLQGLSLPLNCEEAVRILSPICKQIVANMSRWDSRLVDIPRIGRAESSLDVDYITYLSIFFPKHSSSQLKVAKLYLSEAMQSGNGLERAFNQFAVAFDHGSAEAAAYLGHFYLEGTPFLERDYLIARELFLKAARQNISEGFVGLGIVYMYGLGVDSNYTEARMYFSLARQPNQSLSDGDCFLHSGILRLFGLETGNQDYQGAREEFIVGSSIRNIPSIFYLAELHAKGLGIYESCRISSEFYSLVGENGIWRHLGVRAYGLWKSGRTKQAYHYYTLLTEIGVRSAMANSIQLLFRGDVNDQGRMLQLLKRAVKHNEKDAHRMLGSVYYYGMGVPVDMEAAFKHYSAIASQDREAMFSVGYMYEHGLGVDKDLSTAQQYYESAGKVFETWASTRMAILKMKVVALYRGPVANVLISFILVLSSILFFYTSWRL